MSFFNKVTYLVFLSFLFFISFQSVKGQNKDSADSLVRLLKATSAELIEKGGENCRKVSGPAKFLHNGTYLICDTAFWYVDRELIKAVGNVKIIQDRTVLTSDNLDYYIKNNLAQFRGSLVQLQDSDNNTLRTNFLDYNTKDSVAVFMDGGAMRDKDGQVIESLTGTYDSKIKLFTFNENVNMFTDSVFVRTSKLYYQSDSSLATFGLSTHAWKEDKMLSSEGGRYDRKKDIFFFKDKVHALSKTQEGWADSLYYYRYNSDIEMLGNVQLMDTVKEVGTLTGYLYYKNADSEITMKRSPAVLSKPLQNGIADTLWFGADKMIYKAIRKFEIDSITIASSKARLAEINTDPVAEYRKKAAAEAAKAAAEAEKQDPNKKAQEYYKNLQKRQKAAEASKNELVDTVKQVKTVPDSVKIDTLKLKTPLDSSKIGFLKAFGNAKAFRKNMQMSCDSLLYSDLDSLVRLYKEPVIWNDMNRQYSADSITLVINNNSMTKAALMSDAFIVIQEDSLHFDQIKGAEMTAYFGKEGELSRFDAMGGTNTLFYLREGEDIATVNKVEAKMLSALFKDNDVEKIFYYDAAKNDAYPIVQLPRSDSKMKGFLWQKERRPEDRNAITPLNLRPAQRAYYEAVPRAEFHFTDKYFPGYIDEVHRIIARNDSLRIVAEQRRKEEQAAKTKTDSVSENSKTLKDSLSIKSDSTHVSDSLKSASDSLTEKKLSRKELRIKEREAARAKRLEAKKQKALERKRARTLKLLKEMRKEEEREQRLLEKYIRMYAERKARQEKMLK